MTAFHRRAALLQSWLADLPRTAPDHGLAAARLERAVVHGERMLEELLSAAEPGAAPHRAKAIHSMTAMVRAAMDGADELRDEILEG